MYRRPQPDVDIDEKSNNFLQLERAHTIAKALAPLLAQHADALAKEIGATSVQIGEAQRRAARSKQAEFIMIEGTVTDTDGADVPFHITVYTLPKKRKKT